MTTLRCTYDFPMLPFETQSWYSERFSAPPTFRTNTCDVVTVKIQRIRSEKKNVLTGIQKHVIGVLACAPLQFACDGRYHRMWQASHAYFGCCEQGGSLSRRFFTGKREVRGMKTKRRNRRQHRKLRSAFAQQTFLMPFSLSTTADNKPTMPRTQEAINVKSDNFCLVITYYIFITLSVQMLELSTLHV